MRIVTNMNTSVNAPYKMDIKAVVMAAGTGSRMRELTSSIPKCLLPVGNVPLISCSLNLLRRAGIRDVIVLVQEGERAKVQNAIETSKSADDDWNLDIVSVPGNEDWGTADSLRFVKDKISGCSDVVVLSCDLVTDFRLSKLLILHRTRNSALSILLAPFPKSLREIDTPGCKKRCKFERDIVGLDPTSGRLVFVNSEADFDEEGGVPLKLSTLRRNPEVRVHSGLVDAHCYILRRDLVDFIVRSEQISTIKGEFLPAAVKKQFSTRKLQQDSNKSKDEEVTGKQQDSNKSNNKASGGNEEDWMDLKRLSLDMSSWRDPCSQEELRCFACVADEDSLCLRVNSLVAYADANRKISGHFQAVVGSCPRQHRFPKSQVDAESVLGDNCELLNKVSVRGSVIGDHCRLTDKVKISNSVVMENVRIGKDCVIQNSIVCSNVTVEDVCCLKNCIVGPDQTVKERTKLSSEILQCSNQLMEI